MTVLKATGFSLTDKEREIIARVSAERDLHNESAALRQIVNEWARLNPPAQPITAQLTIEQVAVPAQGAQ